MLLSYSPAVKLGNDGKPSKMGVARCGRGYHQLLYSLLNEVSLQDAEWLCTLTVPQGWVGFMGRCYTAYVQVRLMKRKKSADVFETLKMTMDKA